MTFADTELYEWRPGCFAREGEVFDEEKPCLWRMTDGRWEAFTQTDGALGAVVFTIKGLDRPSWLKSIWPQRSEVPPPPMRGFGLG